MALWRRVTRVLVGAGVLTLVGLTPAFAFTSHKLRFEVQVKGEVSPYSVLGVYALPGEVLQVEVVRGSSSLHSYRLEVDGASVSATEPGVWSWTAPTAPCIRCCRSPKAS